MKNENTRALYNYWDDLRSGRYAPYRSEVDPRTIAPLLENTFILEHSGDATPRFRLAGTRLCEQFGLELRGMSALALWHGDCRQRMRALLARVVRDPCVGHVSCTVETRGGALYEAEFLYLPLRNDLGEMTRILGCGHYMGGPENGVGRNEPIHHWIDTLRSEGINAPMEADAGGADAISLTRPRMGGAAQTPRATRASSGDWPRIETQRTYDAGSDVDAIRDALSRLRQQNAPRLRAIEGGRRDGDDIDAALQRPRPRLRLVKTDIA